jgi:flavorubredoxin
MKSEIIFESGDHKWVVLGRDTTKKNEVIDTNEFMIISNGEAMLLDPGGIEIFPSVLAEITKYVSIEQIKVIFASHQDPDISSSLAMWLDLAKHIKIYCSWVWTGFISHFGMGTDFILHPIPDEGMELKIGENGSNVYLVPAHYCHSSGNFSVYDPKANILFTGDIGAALIPEDYPLFVEDFTTHIKYMEKFHLRWMPSQTALRQWVRRVRTINPSILAPQHGAIFAGENVHKFLDWLDNLEVGKWEMGAEASDINKAVWMKWKK